MNYIFIALEGIKQGLGTGHVVRVKRAIEFLLSSHSFEEINITFLTNNLEHAGGYKHIFVDSFDSVKNTVNVLIDSDQVDVIFFDCLDYGQSLYAECQARSIFTIGVDTSSKASSYLDLLINPVITNKASYLSGSLFSVHYQANERRAASTSFRDSIVLNPKESIFICFGGIDYNNHLDKIAPYLSSIPESYDIKIISNNPDSINMELGKRNNIEIYYRPENFFELLKESNYAIISGGVLLQESMYLGIPSFVLPQYDHQLDIAKKHQGAGSILDFASINPDYEKTIHSFIDCIQDKDFVDNVSLNSRSSDDGFGINRIAAITRLYDYLEWDSNFFNKEIFRLNTKCYSQSAKSKLDLLIKNKKTDLIYLLCRADDSKSINFAKQDGFIKVGDKLTYAMIPKDFKPKSIRGGAIIRRSGSNDIKELMNLAKTATWTSRYYNDPQFNNEDLLEFYSNWVAKSVTGRLDDLVFHIENNNMICGFISIKKSGINFGSIGLITVAKEMEGKGFGSALVSHAVDYMFSSLDCSRVEVVTQEDNKSACLMYEKTGFKPFNYSTWLHKWT